MDKMDINTQMIMASSLNVGGKRSELLANIVKEVGGTEYISGPSGVDYLDLNYFNDIKVTFFNPNVENYYSMLYNIQKGKTNG